MYGIRGNNDLGLDINGSLLEVNLRHIHSIDKLSGSNYNVRPSILFAICSAFPSCKRGLIEFVVNELFYEFIAKPDGMIEDAKYGLCIPTLYSVLLLTVCHVHKLKDYEEEWFEEFLKNKKFPLLTPSGCKSEALLNLLNALACFGSSLKRRPASMQGVELVLLRLGISFYFSLCYIMDHPFSTNRFIRALITGAHEWIHGSQNNYYPNKFNNLSSNRRNSLRQRRNKDLVQEHTVKSLIGIFDDFSIKLICNYGYRPHCITWNEINMYIQNMNDFSLLNLYRFTQNNGGFFEEVVLEEFLKSFLLPKSDKKSSIERLSNSSSPIINRKNSDYLVEEYTINMIDSSCIPTDNYQKEDTFSLSEFQDSDDEEIDNEFDQEFSEKMSNSVHNTNRALNAISSKLKGMAVTTSGRIFNFNRLSKKHSSKIQINRGGPLKNTHFENNSIARKPSWSQFAHVFSNQDSNSISNSKLDLDDSKHLKPNVNKQFLNYISYKQQIYECDDDEDPLNVL